MSAMKFAAETRLMTGTALVLTCSTLPAVFANSIDFGDDATMWSTLKALRDPAARSLFRQDDIRSQIAQLLFGVPKLCDVLERQENAINVIL